MHPVAPVQQYSLFIPRSLIGEVAKDVAADGIPEELRDARELRGGSDALSCLEFPKALGRHSKLARQRLGRQASGSSEAYHGREEAGARQS